MMIFKFEKYRELAKAYIAHEKARMKLNYVDKNEHESLTALKTYLDDCGVKMPKPNYIYDSADVRTHKFLGLIVNEHEKQGVIIRKIKPVFNPTYLYANLSPVLG